MIENPHFNNLCQRGPKSEMAVVPFKMGRSQGQIHIEFGCPKRSFRRFNFYFDLMRLPLHRDFPKRSKAPTKDSASWNGEAICLFIKQIQFKPKYPDEGISARILNQGTFGCVKSTHASLLHLGNNKGNMPI
jgi:hypothetical protein